MASQSNTARQRREIHFSGWVQGVGFRYTTRAIAGRFDVRGFVQNLPDGRVLLVVEGRPTTLDEFLAAIEGELSRYIKHREITAGPANDEFTRFEVRH
jgi:acylphosphatase